MTKFIRCRLEKVLRPGEQTKKPTFIREWIAEPDAALGNVIVREGISSWKIVSIDRGTFMERV